ncbi:hypothetical protein FRC19_011037 [Serendipita sp. 401]|nr:hypothetical protein FRC19_011037 [Serendipita sp. 401]KAG9054955.1 hypothetical protein FS842_003696 [Serendipita sp. 407]
MESSMTTHLSSTSSNETIKGQCRCGCVTYEFPKASDVDLEDKNLSELYKRLIVPPEKQKFPERGGHSNKWRACHCHCAACRQTAGALVVSCAYIPAEHFKITRKEKTGIYRASNHAYREFCLICGAALFFYEDRDINGVDITLATITTPRLFDYFELVNHVWVEDAADIVLDKDGKGGGLATIFNDDLPRMKRDSASEAY